MLIGHVLIKNGCKNKLSFEFDFLGKKLLIDFFGFEIGDYSMKIPF